MRFEFGFLNDLKNDLNKLKAGHTFTFNDCFARQGALTESKLISLVCSMQQERMLDLDHAKNEHVKDYLSLFETNLALEAIKNNQVAFVVMAGGTGSRLGYEKFNYVIPGINMRSALLKITQSSISSDENVNPVPVWFMTSPTNSFILHDYLLKLSSRQRMVGSIIEQFQSIRLTVDNRIIDPTNPTFYTTGTGDLGPALLESRIFDDQHNKDIKYCYVVANDNILASLDLAILNEHIKHKNSITCEVTTRKNGDSDGVLVLNSNRLEVVDESDVDDNFLKGCEYSYTNSMIVNVELLKKDIDWRWRKVRKQIGYRLFNQFERSACQYMEVENATYINVPREKRYFPVKTQKDLDAAGVLLNGNNK